jgi:hypothetical protein
LPAGEIQILDRRSSNLKHKAQKGWRQKPPARQKSRIT